MLDLALQSSVVVLVSATVLLVLAGSRPVAGQRWRISLAVALVASAVAVSIVLASPGPAVAGIATAGVQFLFPRRWYVVGTIFFAGLLVTAAIYGLYLARATFLLTHDLLSLALGAMLLGLEVGAIFLVLASAFEMVDALCSPAESPILPPVPARWPVVCIQVPTYNEPPELVVETIRSLAALDYPALRIQIIDNNTTDDDLWRPVEAECDRLRTVGQAIEFVHLPSWPGYKAGALNWGRAHLGSDVEIVAVVDADYLVDPAWLKATVPFFSDSAVAFVQTPQDYRAWDTSSFYRACYVGFAYFFKVGMVSRAHRNAIIFAGTMGLIRRSVLDDVGGWDELIITEDAEISVRILALGHRSVYVPRAYGRGIMPLTYEGLRKQRFRWAFGGIQILRRHWRTLLGPQSGLSPGQRYDHLIGGLWWFNDALTFGFSIFVAITAAGAIVGRPFVVQRLTGIGLVLPVGFVLLNLIRYLWGLRTSTGVGLALALAGLRVNLSLSWVVALACLRGFTQERGVFLRTPKFSGAAAIRELRLVVVETALAAAAVLLLFLVLVRAPSSPFGLVLAGLLGWAALIYGSALGYALGDPTRAPIGDAFRDKMALEIAPRIGRVARSRPARLGLAAAALLVSSVGIAIVAESGRPPIAELPFRELPGGPPSTPVGGSPTPTGPASSPSLRPSPTGLLGPPGGSPGSPGGATPRSTIPSAGGTQAPPGPTPGPTPSPTPGPGRTPPVPVPTPTALPTPPVPVPTQPRPSPSRRP